MQNYSEQDLDQQVNTRNSDRESSAGPVSGTNQTQDSTIESDSKKAQNHEAYALNFSEVDPQSLSASNVLTTR